MDYSNIDFSKNLENIKESATEETLLRIEVSLLRIEELLSQLIKTKDKASDPGI